ncbi:MAG: hypothetical protein KAJ46_04755, partial [Sedimentisphaerales bacterium]|nr:hypothetical protein [Sedimentisphaerales bacterium]
DLLEISSLIDRVGIFGKSVHLTDVQVPSAPDPRDNNGRVGEAGYWHNKWSEQVQAEWFEQVYRIGLSRAYVETITWQDLVDKTDGILQNGGLLKSDFTPKPAFIKLCQLKKDLVRTSRRGQKTQKGDTQ